MRRPSPRMTTPVVSQDTTDDLTSSSGGIATRLAPPCVSADFGPARGVVSGLLGKRCLMKKVNRGRARISRDVFQTKVCNEIVFRCVRMIFDDAAKARGQLVLHVKTRIG